jgi:hypothetical protein
VYTVIGPEGQQEGVFDSEIDAMDYAADMSREFSAPFSVRYMGVHLVTFSPRGGKRG